jgi:AcrR family transcriptional regulator
MQREEKSERSRRVVLDAALALFSHQGYRGTSVREIADAAGVSTGNVYHHFPDKETIFQTLIQEFWTASESRLFPFNRALSAGAFPTNLEQLGYAARDSVREYSRYVALMYVDVIEFEGKHIRSFYSEMGARLIASLGEQGALEALHSHLRPSVSPTTAMLLTSRFFFTYFAVEVLFDVPEPFGIDSDQLVKEIADILRYGMFKPEA